MIDWQRVQTLRDEIGAEDFEEVVPLFIDEVSTVTEKLRTNPDTANLAGDLHFLKGSALNLGFAAFSTLCHAGEVRATAGDAESVDIGEILDCFDQSKLAFDAGLDHGICP
ncbi:MAG: Hpt domain-containing protein [Pseudomonadota bacterium]